MHLEHYGEWIKFSRINVGTEWIQLSSLTEESYKKKLRLYVHCWLYVHGEYANLTDVETERYIVSYGNENNWGR